MNEIFNRNLAGLSLFGLGYFQLIVNNRGEAEDYLFQEINPAFEELTGLRRENVLGKRASEIFPGKKNGGFDWLSFYGSVVRSGKTQERIQWIEGAGIYCKITVVSSNKDCFVILIQDISEVMNATNSFIDDKRENEYTLEDWETVFNSTHDAMLLVGYDGIEFRCLRNNAVHQKLTGFNNIEGTSPADLLGKELGEKLFGYYEQCIRTGQRVTYEQTFNFAPGERVWQTEVIPIYGHDGIRHLLCSSKDITELKLAQVENEALVQHLQSMFNRHTAIILIIEPISGTIIDANPAACDFYGYSKDELLMLMIKDINMLPEEEVEQQRLMAYEEKEHYFLFPHRLKNGDIRLVDVYSCPVYDKERTLLYSIIFDATDRERYRDELILEKEMLRTTLQSIGDGVVTTDKHGVITSLNGVAEEITGWKSNEAVGKDFTEVFRLRNEETGEMTESPIKKVLETGRIVGLANHTVLLNRQGQMVPIADSAAPIRAQEGKIFGVVMVFRDVSKEKEQSEQIRFLSYHDPLTGLNNRYYVEEAMSRLDASRNLPISIVMGDVNGLKITNDVFGHDAGDDLLRHVSEVLQKSCRREDLIARWGGDEFVIFMPRTDLSCAEEIIQKIKSNFGTVGDGSLRLSMSLGCSVKKTAEESIQDVMRQAEEYMYHQKLLDGKSYRNAVIHTLLATLHEKSIETEEHAERMEIYCYSLGQRLQLSSKEMDELSLLAILHDIGKVGISPGILNKPAPLTSTEWEEMKRHPEIGYRIAQSTPELAVVADYILSHHERWDGKGYPHGLKGEEIPLVCRILAVSDAYDAMTNNRTYRKAITKEEAVRELKKNAATQFDPAIVDLFIDILDHSEDEHFSTARRIYPE